MCDIITTIQDAIHQIEEDYHVKVIYAIECGSRLWGFSAANSDYDVRFVYVKPKEEYLRLDPFPDVIHRKVNKILDLDGWDLQKMLRLLYKSNPSVFEWNQSTIIYCKTPQWERISGEIPRYFQVATGFQHYLHLAKGNCRWFLKAAEVWEKKYFHVLRAILACYWILHHHTPPPLNFIQLCDAELDCSIRPAVDRLLEKKRAGKTKRKGKRIEVLNDYIAVSFADLEKKIIQLPKEPYPDWQELNRLFLDTLNSCSFAFMSGGIS